MKKKLDAGNVALVILAVLFLGFCVFGLVLYVRSKRAAAPFEAMQEEAKTACGQCFSLSEESAGAVTPYRRGKVLVVKAETGEAAGLTMANLDPEVRAADPEEVGTLVCAGEVQQEQVGAYEDGEPAYQLHREICIYDLASESMILFQTLSGGEPPPVKHQDGPESGSDPILGTLIDLLEELPIK